VLTRRCAHKEAQARGALLAEVYIKEVIQERQRYDRERRFCCRREYLFYKRTGLKARDMRLLDMRKSNSSMARIHDGKDTRDIERGARRDGASALQRCYDALRGAVMSSCCSIN